MPDPIQTDVKPEAAPSVASTPASAKATDAIVESSPTKSEPTASAKPLQTMESVINDAFKKSTEGSSQEPVKEEVDKEVVEEKEEATTPEEEKVENEDDKKEDVVDEENTEKADEKGPVPYERFQEVVAKRNEIETKLKEYEPLAAQHQRIVEYCGQNSITQEQFSQGLEIIALMNTDPAKALEKLAPLYNELQGFVGNKLPEDLQKDVDAGDLPLTRAKEIAQLRAQSKFGENRSKQTAEQAKARQEREFQSALTSAATTWDSAKRTSDPDYKPKAKEDAPDGKWELTRDKFLALLHQQNMQGQFTNPVSTPQQMSQLLERAYQQVNETFSGLLKGRKPTKVLTRTGSSTTLPKSPAQAKSMEEAMSIAASKHGY